MRHKFTWDDFLQMKVIRCRDGRGEIVVDYCQNNHFLPVHLIGFTADPDLTDYEILELGFEHYELLLEALGRA